MNTVVYEWLANGASALERAVAHRYSGNGRLILRCAYTESTVLPFSGQEICHGTYTLLSNDLDTRVGRRHGRRMGGGRRRRPQRRLRARRGCAARTGRLIAGTTAITEQRWADAIKSLDRHVSRNYRDADAQNWLGYANRKAGRLDEAFKHYKVALTVNPNHLGAHEYIGEAFVMAGQLPEARKHLEKLSALCGTQCEQYRDLAEAIQNNRVSSTTR